MKVLFPILSLLMSLAIPNILEARTPSSINICTPAWASYTQKDGKGLYHELFSKIFKQEGVSLNITYAPHKRCRRYLRLKKVDGVPGFYREKNFKVLYSRLHIGEEHVSVVYRKGFLNKWTGQSNMANHNVGWYGDYRFKKFGVVTVPVRVREFDTLGQGLHRLVHKRIDFVLDYEHDILEQIKKHKWEDKLTVAVGVIPDKKYYMTFSRSPRGKGFLKLWNQKMESLKRSGELKRLYRKYGDRTH